MRRRSFVRAAGALAATGALARFALASTQVLEREKAIADWRGRIESFLAKDVIPILDPEATYNSGIDLGWMREQMDQLGVSQVCFAPHARLGSEASLRLYREHPAYFIPTTMDASSPHWYQHTDQFNAQIRKDLATGNYLLMGEYEVRHYRTALQNQAHRDVTLPIDGRAMHEVFQTATDTGLAFMLHYEIEDALLPPLEAMLARYPKAKVIWCHLGQIRKPELAKLYGVPYVRSLIERFPQLHFDFGHGGPNSIHQDTRQYDQTIFVRNGSPPWGGVLHADWLRLIEDHPGRFLASSDIDQARFGEFTRKILRFRDLILGRLSPRARERVAYQNAWRLITGEEWRA
jgi:hypothetical protein